MQRRAAVEDMKGSWMGFVISGKTSSWNKKRRENYWRRKVDGRKQNGCKITKYCQHNRCHSCRNFKSRSWAQICLIKLKIRANSRLKSSLQWSPLWQESPVTVSILSRSEIDQPGTHLHHEEARDSKPKLKRQRVCAGLEVQKSKRKPEWQSYGSWNIDLRYEGELLHTFHEDSHHKQQPLWISDRRIKVHDQLSVTSAWPRVQMHLSHGSGLMRLQNNEVGEGNRLIETSQWTTILTTQCLPPFCYLVIMITCMRDSGSIYSKRLGQALDYQVYEALRLQVTEVVSVVLFNSMPVSSGSMSLDSSWH